ncbi:NERD domain-containing protein [Candidatus Saccharibacteria bacterium]|nr:NERD domain-containing protein [Candidatus Saccharibacteria bacterium]
MPQFLYLFSVIATIFLFVLAGIIWLFQNNGLDKLKHPEEWKTAGSSGERIVYNMLIKKFHIPENQILRNVYIPTGNSKTSEIDLLIISKKGLFVVECKNYGGYIYGDAKLPKWIQYIGGQKNFFYNPLFQNKNHAKCLSAFLAQHNISVPIIPIISTITRGNWKIRNLRPNDYVLGLNCHLKDIYENLPDSPAVTKHYKSILASLTPLSRPDESVRQKHVAQILLSRK